MANKIQGQTATFPRLHVSGICLLWLFFALMGRNGASYLLSPAWAAWPSTCEASPPSN